MHMGLPSDKWVPSLSDFKIASLRPYDTEATLVKHLINWEDSTWNFPLLRELFSDDEVEAIMRIPFSVHQHADSLVWHLSNNGEYVVKLGYHRYMANKRMIEAASSTVARNSYGVIVDGINAQVPASSTLVAECLALRLSSHLIE
ncbi:hypothetical protein V6N12_025295 [Hibiscus sabdariffa]|uniref:Uncharacterized protein n=1 Tax=Hibiscus sabdariffa TaxID=183260 RepID=A0ABR1ZES0_9ROSI